MTDINLYYIKEDLKTLDNMVNSLINAYEMCQQIGEKELYTEDDL